MVDWRKLMSGQPSEGDTVTTEEPDERQAPEAAQEVAPGWYKTQGALRYFDGSDWTDHIAPPASLTRSDIAAGVFLGVFAALFLVWLGAQVDPDVVYFPVKFVVDRVPEF